MLTLQILEAQNKQLRAKIDELQETVRQLNERSAMEADPLPDGLPTLTNLEDKLLRLLLARPGLRTHAFILEALYQGADERLPNIIKVMVSRLRRKVGHVINIKTVWGRGYVATLVNDTLTGHMQTGVSSNSEQRAA